MVKVFYLPKPISFYFSYTKSMAKFSILLVSELKVKMPILKGVLALVPVN